MDITPINQTTNHSKSELEKFKLFYEFDTTEKEIRAEIKQQVI